MCCLLGSAHRKKDAKIRVGRSAGDVLEEVHRSEFYVTDDDCSFLLCFNHHDFLVYPLAEARRDLAP